MVQRITSQSPAAAQASVLSLDGEESFSGATVDQPAGSSLYTLTVAVRLGFVVVILLKALAIWQW